MNINTSTLINGDYIMEIIIGLVVIVVIYLVYSIIRDKGNSLDLNNDGKVDAADLTALNDAVADRVKEAAAKVTAAADINKDGKVDAADAKAAVGKAKAAVKKATTKKKAAPKKKAVVKKKAVAKKKK